ncbi:hypothetical protein [Streptomyces sp. NPDC047071]|uniref:hypothetical protein n=1 Tax=Streptomyces sp. NPDC047071 TaxID=3154808 RepID=UPI003452C2E1
MRRHLSLTAAAATLAALTAGFAPADDGANPPAGGPGYHRAADFTTAGKPLDIALHPDSGKLYVGSDDDTGTADVNETGLYVLDRADGTVRGRTAEAPGATGALGAVAVRRIAGPLPGDGVVFHYPLKGLGTARGGDPRARGVWLPGAKVTDVGPGVAAGTTLVAQGTALTEVDTATGSVRRTVTLAGGGRFAVDARREAVWSADLANNRLYRVDTGSFTVTRTVELPVTEGVEGFTAVDPGTGAVWVGRQDKIMVFGADGTPRTTLTGTDLATDVAFDGGRAYVARQDVGDPDAPDYDGRGSLTVLDTRTLKPSAKPVPLQGNVAQLGAAAVAVAPGGAEVFVTSPAQGRVTRIVPSTPPRVTRSPQDVTAEDGAEVTLTARAEGSPAPVARWQRSTDGGRSWRAAADAAGPPKASYTLTARAAQDGHRFRAEFTNDAGTAHTEPATLTVAGARPGDDPGDEPSDEPDGGGPDSGTTGGSGNGAGPGSGSGTGGGSGSGSVGGSGTASPTGGSLASTGVAVTSAAALAAALVATGWYARRRAGRTRLSR